MNSKLAGCNHTYMKKFIQDIDYCSDSEGRWRFNTPFEIIEKNKNNPVFTLHLLTHPIWWTTPSNMSPGEKVDFYLKKKYLSSKKVSALNCKSYSKFLKN